MHSDLKMKQLNRVEKNNNDRLRTTEPVSTVFLVKSKNSLFSSEFFCNYFYNWFKIIEPVWKWF